MNIKLTNTMLDKIRNRAMQKFHDNPNPAYEPQYHNILCVLNAFVLEAKAEGHNINLEQLTTQFAADYQED